MLAGQMRSPLLLSRLVLIPKAPDLPAASAASSSGQSSAISLRPLNLPEIFYRLTARAAVKIKSPAVGAAMETLQLGVGVPSDCQIGAKGAQRAFDARRAVEAFDLNSAFTKERRQDNFQGGPQAGPSLAIVLCVGLWQVDSTSLVRTSCRLGGNRGEAGRPGRPIVLRCQYFRALRVYP